MNIGFPPDREDHLIDRVGETPKSDSKGEAIKTAAIEEVPLAFRGRVA